MEIQFNKDSVGSWVKEDASGKERTNILYKIWIFRKCSIEYVKMRMDIVIIAF